MRAAIASRTCLASTWANRPNWVFHHMALGEHIGYSAKITMTNTGLYTPHFWGLYVHNALLGDPTIRMHVLAPVENLSANQAGIHVQLAWQDPANALGYFIYKKTATDTAYLLLNQVPVTGTEYIDACPDSGLVSYMVRSVELRTSASGTYYNLSQGATVSFLNNPPAWVLEPVVTMSTAGQSNGSVSISPQNGCAPYHFEWNTGETTAAIQDLDAGLYCVTVNDCLGCAVSYCAIVEEISNLSGLPSLMHSRIFPNPIGEKLVLELHLNNPQDIQLEIMDARGRSVGSRNCSGQDIHLEWDVPFLAAGYYWLRIEGAHTVVMHPFAKTGG